jgi:hypothetical protein
VRRRRHGPAVAAHGVGDVEARGEVVSVDGVVPGRVDLEFRADGVRRGVDRGDDDELDGDADGRGRRVELVGEDAEPVLDDADLTGSRATRTRRSCSSASATARAR